MLGLTNGRGIPLTTGTWIVMDWTCSRLHLTSQAKTLINDDDRAPYGVMIVSCFDVNPVESHLAVALVMMFVVFSSSHTAHQRGDPVPLSDHLQ
jgi:hypothetical protein